MDLLDCKVSISAPDGKKLLIMHANIKHWHPVSLNKLLTPNLAYRSQMKKKDYAVVANHVRQWRPAKSIRAIFVRINLTKGQRACDVDAYSKCLLDALVESKMLIDDSYKHAILLPFEFSRGKCKSTDIYLYEAIDADEKDN